MYNLIYSDIVKNYLIVLKYCLKYSNNFSVITNLKKPYSKRPPSCEHDIWLLNWSSCLINQIIGIKKWPGTETKDNHKVMNVYNSRKFRTTFINFPNLFLPIENNLPEDICFYRGGKPWFATITHEKMAFMMTATKDDLNFLQQNKIGYHIECN